MYYIVAGKMIVDTSEECPSQSELQEWANALGSVWVIDGERQ